MAAIDPSKITVELRGWFERRTFASDLPDPFNSVEWHPERTFTQVFFPAPLLGVLLFSPESIPTVALPRSYERPWRTSPPVGVSTLLIGSGSI
jgi:hypothetical protein